MLPYPGHLHHSDSVPRDFVALRVNTGWWSSARHIVLRRTSMAMI